nr:hypothetical protein [Tanacetum cinerariifolium]
EFEEQKKAMDQMMKKDAEGEEMYEQMHKFMQDMNVAMVRQEKKGPIIVGQHYGLSAQATPSYDHNMATPNWQTLFHLLPKKRGDKTKNKGKNANASPLNLRNAFADDNVGGEDVMIMGECETGNYFVYENVDSNK